MAELKATRTPSHTFLQNLLRALPKLSFNKFSKISEYSKSKYFAIYLSQQRYQTHKWFALGPKRHSKGEVSKKAFETSPCSYFLQAAYACQECYA